MSYIPSDSTAMPDTTDVADHQYTKEDYEGSSEIEQGTAVTHEQTSDSYMSGNNEEDYHQLD